MSKVPSRNGSGSTLACTRNAPGDRVLALTCHIELFTEEHYRQSIEPTAGLSPIFKDVFRFHWKEESQHAILDELEWRREDRKLTPHERDLAVDDLIALVGAVDGLLQLQAAADVTYFVEICSGHLGPKEIELLRAGVRSSPAASRHRPR